MRRGWGSRSRTDLLPRSASFRTVGLIRALKGGLGHYERPEGRGEPFRARVFAESAPFAALRAGFQRTDQPTINRRSTRAVSKSTLV